MILFFLLTRVPRDFRLDIEGFHFYLEPRRSAAGKDVSSGGIAILVRSELRKAKAVRILEDQSNHECDILRIKLDKKFFNTENDTFVGGIYIPPANSNYIKLNNIDMFSILDKDVAHFNSLEHVITCGDFNSRIGSLQDGIIESARANNFITLPNDYQIDNLPKRHSLDTKTNRYKKPFLDFFSSCSDLI